MRALALKSERFVADGSPETLKRMEAWYYQLFESHGFEKLGISREEFECCMASYFCHVAVTNCNEAVWTVAEYAFEKGKYEIGVTRGLVNVLRSSFKDHYKRHSNTRRTSVVSQR